MAEPSGQDNVNNILAARLRDVEEPMLFEEIPYWMTKLIKEELKKLEESYKAYGNSAITCMQYEKALQDNHARVMKSHQELKRTALDAERAIAIKEDSKTEALVHLQETPQWVFLLNDEEKKKLAEFYKLKGNFAMKCTEYEKALQLYSKAIAADCSDDDLMAALHNNRAAAKFHLKDYPRALVDAERAIAIREDYLKPRWRAAQCAFQLKRYKLAEKFCTETIAQIKDEADAQQLRIRDEAKKLDIEIKKGFETFQYLVDAVKHRRVKFCDLRDGEPITEDTLCPKGCPVERSVHFRDDNSGTLIWSACVSFPDIDYTAKVGMYEHSFLSDVLDLWLPEILPVDCPRREEFCRSENVNVYVIRTDPKGSFHKIDHILPVYKILEDKNAYIQSGMIMMAVVLPALSDWEKNWTG